MNAAFFIALATSVLAAAAFYTSSKHCLWTSIRRWHRWSLALATVLAAVSITLWIVQLGIGVGLCVALCTGMLTLVVLPWIALRTSASHAAEHD